MRPMVKIIDINAQEEIVREMNDAEYEQHLIDKSQEETQQAEAEALTAAKAVAKAELLATLNLSQETLDILKALD